MHKLTTTPPTRPVVQMCSEARLAFSARAREACYICKLG